MEETVDLSSPRLRAMRTRLISLLVQISRMTREVLLRRFCLNGIISTVALHSLRTTPWVASPRFHRRNDELRTRSGWLVYISTNSL